MNAKQRKETRTIVDRAWHALPYLQGKSFSDGAAYLARVTEAEEKTHRRHAPEQYRHVATIRESARLMIVHDIARCLHEPEVPTWGAFLQRRESWIIAAAYAELNAEDIRKAWAGIDCEELRALDYADYVNAD